MIIKSKFSHQRTHEFEEYYLPNIHTSLYVHEAHWRKVPASWSYPAHEESIFEINYVIEGVQLCKLNNQHHILQAGDFIIIRPFEMHENFCASESGLTYFCLHFDLNDILFRKMLCNTENTFFPKEK
ncbi:AraC family ligand binding domain-containing protein [Paenibacillus rhizoplanae]